MNIIKGLTISILRQYIFYTMCGFSLFGFHIKYLYPYVYATYVDSMSPCDDLYCCTCYDGVSSY